MQIKISDRAVFHLWESITKVIWHFVLLGKFWSQKQVEVEYLVTRNKDLSNHVSLFIAFSSQHMASFSFLSFLVCF